MTACDLTGFLHKQRQLDLNMSDHSSNGYLQGGKINAILIIIVV